MVDLKLESVSKRYRIQSDSSSSLSNAGLLAKLRSTRGHWEDFWALKDINVEVQRGESLGIIGHNGAGKSTILKLLSNITTPSRGRITIHGRLAALLEVGSGFHPELTGRENTYLSGSILGMRRSEITGKLDSIIDFAGIRPFIDIPVKRYSSGMYVRLGFAIAAHLNPDILLLDEVLAVGDLSFQEKCKERIAELHRQGMTMIFISHDLTAVSKLCQRTLLLQRGEVIAEGLTSDVIRQYTDLARFRPAPRIDGEARSAEVTSVVFTDGEAVQRSGFKTGKPLVARIEFTVHRPLPDGAISLYFVTAQGTTASQLTTSWNNRGLNLPEGPNSVEFTVDELGLAPGVYQIDALIEHARTKERVEWQNACTSIHVEKGTEFRGAFYMPHRWRAF